MNIDGLGLSFQVTEYIYLILFCGEIYGVKNCLKYISFPMLLRKGHIFRIMLGMYILSIFPPLRDWVPFALPDVIG